MPNLVHIYSLSVAQHSLTWRSKGQRSRSRGYENCHSCMAGSEVCCCSHVLLPVWDYVMWLLRFQLCVGWLCWALVSVSCDVSEEKEEETTYRFIQVSIVCSSQASVEVCCWTAVFLQVSNCASVCCYFYQLFNLPNHCMLSQVFWTFSATGLELFLQTITGKHHQKHKNAEGKPWLCKSFVVTTNVKLPMLCLKMFLKIQLTAVRHVLIISKFLMHNLLLLMLVLLPFNCCFFQVNLGQLASPSSALCARVL